jgi:hypothetical protein
MTKGKWIDIDVERRPYTFCASCIIESKAEIAQMVEHGTENPRVTSSILVLGKLSFAHLIQC